MIEKNIILLLPLNIGNKWCYIEKLYDENAKTKAISNYVLEIKKTHKSKNKLWYLIENSKNSFIENYYRIDEKGLWYKIPQFFPNESFLILNFQKNESEKLIIKDIFSNDKECSVETILIDKSKEIISEDVTFYCYQYNIYKVNNKTNSKELYRECFYSQGVGLILENEYKVVNNKEILTSSRSLTMYNIVK